MPDPTQDTRVPVPLDIVRALQPHAAAMGLDLGIGQDGTVDPVVIPPICLAQCPVGLAQQLGDQLRGEDLFVTPAGEVVELQGGKQEPMDPVRFVTWAGERTLLYKKRAEDNSPIRAGMTTETARIVLASTLFRDRLRKLMRVIPVRVPVRRHGGAVELLSPGYDWETATYVLDDVRYDLGLPLEDAVRWLREFVGEYPWGDNGRSLAVWLCSVLAPYCHILAPWLAPMFVFNANQAGSGKTTLARMGALAVYGTGAVKPWSREDGKLREEFNSTAKANRPILILDNVKGHVSSEELEAWLTSSEWEFRQFHSQMIVSCRKNTLTYLSGNEATLSDDLIRRSLLVDLFSEEASDERAANRKGVEIEEVYLASDEVRGQLLGAMWALVRNWADKGCPPPGSKLASYQRWADVVAGIVVAAGFEDPLSRAELTAGGDSSRTEFRTLLEAARAAHPGKTSILLRLPEWAALARHAGCYHFVIGSVDEARQHMEERRLFKQPVDVDGPREFTEQDFVDQAARYLDKPASTKLGAILYRKRGIKHRLSDGEIWQFGARKSRHSTFELMRVMHDDPTPDSGRDAEPKVADPF